MHSISSRSHKHRHEVGKQAINAAIDLFHRRWVLRLIWELRGAALTFRQLQEACGEISPTVLNQRLSELREAHVVEHVAAQGYRLTAQGRALLTAMQPMLDWALTWFKELHTHPSDENEDAQSR